MMETADVRPFLLVGNTRVTANPAKYLRATFGDALTVSSEFSFPLPPPEAAASTPIDTGPMPGLAIGLFPLAERVAYREFERTARGAQIPALSVAVEDDATLIGPLTLPTIPGCGYCARLRMIAATAARGRPLTAETRRPAWSIRDLRRLATQVRSVLHSGRQAQRLMRHVLAIDRVDSTLSRHRFVPMPYCEICGGAAAIARERSTKGLDGWVDPLIGVVTGLAVESPADTGLECPTVITAAPPYMVERDGAVRQLPIGWGKGLTPTDAVLSAVGEAIERYAASLPDRARIEVARPEDLDGPYLDPSLFSLYTAEQYARADFPFAPYDPSVTHPWVRGWWFATGEPVWVHTAFVYLFVEVRRDQFICQGSSNGLAASTSINDASLRATMELVERDGLMHAWLTATPGRPVELDHTLDPQLKSIIDGVEALGAAVEVYVLDTSAYGTTALCISLGDGRQWPGVTLALGADLNPMTAIRHAILELGQTGPHLRRLLQNRTWPIPPNATAVSDMLDHAAYYFPEERRHEFDRIRHGGTPIALEHLTTATPSSCSSRLKDCQRALDGAGIRVAIVDVTSPDVRTGPFRVARAVSPDLQGLSYGFGLQRQPVSRMDRRRAVSAPGVHPIW